MFNNRYWVSNRSQYANCASTNVSYQFLSAMVCRTKAEPNIFYMPAKFSDETEKLLQARKEVAFEDLMNLKGL